MRNQDKRHEFEVRSAFAAEGGDAVDPIFTEK
jgi:hypothetical protein